MYPVNGVQELRSTHVRVLFLVIFHASGILIAMLGLGLRLLQGPQGTSVREEVRCHRKAGALV